MSSRIILMCTDCDDLFTNAWSDEVRRVGGGDVLQDEGDEGESEGQPPPHQVVHSEPPQLGPAGDKRVNHVLCYKNLRILL